MLAFATVLVLLLGSPLSGASGPNAVAVLPEEPEAVVLPDAPILQTIAADVDGDGQREVVRLVRGADDAVFVEVWAQTGEAWAQRGDPVLAVPPSRIGARIDPVYLATPVQLLIRRVDGAERVTVASQPHFEEIDVGPPCCLQLHDLELRDGVVTRREVAESSNFSDALLVIDFDGDGTDEILSTHSLTPLGDLEFPIDARVHRWQGDRFGRPTVTNLPIGSGHAPVWLGDTDGLPGDEAALLPSPPGPLGIYRLRLVEGDIVVADAGGVAAAQAVAVPLHDGRGIATVSPVAGFAVAAWPAGQPIGEPEVQLGDDDLEIVGVVSLAGDRVVLHDPRTEAVRLVDLPGIGSPLTTAVTRSPAAATLAETALAPFSGLIPGGSVGGEPAVIHQGRLVPSPFGSPFDPTSVVASLAGAEPVGLVGRGRETLVLDHASPGVTSISNGRGGVLLAPSVRPSGWTSLVPLETVGQRELDDGAFEPSLRGAQAIDARGTIAVGPGGFVAQVQAPVGSRVFVGNPDPSVIGVPIVVPASGRVDAPFAPPTVATANPRYRATLIVQTPAGRGYLATWNVRVHDQPPELEASSFTDLGSDRVEVRGRVATGSSVRVDGEDVAVDDTGRFSARVTLPPWPTEVEVIADDGFGNMARRTVVGVGVFDYRGLPWVPITALLVAAVGVVLFLRVPRAMPLPRQPDDDARYEEIDPEQGEEP